MKNLILVAALGLFMACDNKTETTHHDHQDDWSGHMTEEHTTTHTSEHADFTLSKHAEVEQVNVLYKEYLMLKNALVENNKEASDQAVESMQSTLEDENFRNMEGEAASLVAQIEQGLNRMEDASVEAKRNEFNNVSMSLFTLLKAADHGVSSAYLQHCSMAFNNQGAFWISDDKEIRNPYYGDKMLKCGAVKESIEG
jgi:hypothetical protein